MEAGFKMEGFACFVSEMSRNICGKEQRLPKGLQELLVSCWAARSTSLSSWLQLGQSLNSSVLHVSQGLPPLGAALSLFGSCMLEVGIRNTHRFFIVMD